MTLFEIFITTIFTATCIVVGYFTHRGFTVQAEALKELILDHNKTKERVDEHDTEIEKQKLEIRHSKEIAAKTENEFKTLLAQNSEKFDQMIDLFTSYIQGPQTRRR